MASVSADKRKTVVVMAVGGLGFQPHPLLPIGEERNPHFRIDGLFVLMATA